MIYLWATLLAALNLLWLLAVLIGLPGTWLMVITTALVAWWQWEAGMFSAWTLGAIVALALVGELLEFLAGMLGARRAGGTGWGAFGALLGAVVGGLAGTFLIPIPLAGALIGACLGAGLGAGLLELAAGQKMETAVKAGVGGGGGRLLGTLGKLAAGIVIWLTVAVAAYWP